MKKITYLIAVLAVATSVAFGQGIVPNGSMERWSTVGGYENPDKWNTSNGSLGTTVVNVTKSTVFQDSAFAARLEAKTVLAGGFFSTPVPGVITTGSISGVTITGGQPYSQKPLKLTGYYQYTPTGTDTASMEVLLTRWNTTSKARETVASGIYFSNATLTTYTPFTVNLVYNKSITAAPDTQLIIISTSKNRQKAVSGSFMFVDHMAWSGIVTGTYEINNVSFNRIYPNPANNEVTITNNSGVSNLMAVYDISGRKLDEVVLENSNTTLNTSAYSKGLYYFTVLGNDNTILERGKFVIMK
jgi:hypothetical protein